MLERTHHLAKHAAGNVRIGLGADLVGHVNVQEKTRGLVPLVVK